MKVHSRTCVHFPAKPLEYCGASPATLRAAGPGWSLPSVGAMRSTRNGVKVCPLCGRNKTRAMIPSAARPATYECASPLVLNRSINSMAPPVRLPSVQRIVSNLNNSPGLIGPIQRKYGDTLDGMFRQRTRRGVYNLLFRALKAYGLGRRNL